VHVCIDDASRIAFSQIYPDQKKESAVGFLKAAVAYYESLAVTVTRVMTDNGSCYRSDDFRDACIALGLKHKRTKPYTPRTNGRPSASSRLLCENGPTPSPTQLQTTGLSGCPSGSTPTTGIGPTAASNTKPQSAASLSPRTTY
jgi:hypothetical protein